MNKYVDIIIPTYKRANMLEKTINSVLEQTYENILITVIDDNDPNSEWRTKTKAIMQHYNNKKIQYICHEKNKNGSAARNTGLKYTKGEFVCFLDDDDFFLKDKIELQIQYLLDYENEDACFCDYIKNGEEIFLKNKKDFSYDILLGLKTPQTSGIMFRRKAIDILQGFDESYYRHQDYELLLRFYDKFLMGKVDKILYVRERSNIDNNPNGLKLEKLKEKFLKQFEYKILDLEKQEKGYQKKVKIYNYIDVMKSYIKEKKIKDSFRIIYYSMKIDVFLTFKIINKNFYEYIKNKF